MTHNEVAALDAGDMVRLCNWKRWGWKPWEACEVVGVLLSVNGINLIKIKDDAGGTLLCNAIHFEVCNEGPSISFR